MLASGGAREACLRPRAEAAGSQVKACGLGGCGRMALSQPTGAVWCAEQLRGAAGMSAESPVGGGAERVSFTSNRLPTASAFLMFIVTSTSPKRRLHYVTMPFGSNKRATFPDGDWTCFFHGPTTGGCACPAQG